MTEALPTPRARPPLSRWRSQAPAILALVPAASVVLFVYVGAMVWTVRLSFSSSKMLPVLDNVGFNQYRRLFATERFNLSVEHIALFGCLFIAGSLVLGFLLAVFIDQRVRGEGVFRTIFLYPYAMSFIVTGLAWQWFLNPELGLQKAVREAGFPDFTFDWIVDPNRVMYTLVIAAIWQASGLVMAILLAGLRGVDAELWKAARIDAIPTWRVYVSIILPMITPMLVTAAVLLAVAVAKLYDLVVAMTKGGPGFTSDLIASIIYKQLQGGFYGISTAGNVVLFVVVSIIAVPMYRYLTKVEVDL